MVSMAKLQHTHHPLQLSFNHHRPLFHKPVSFLRSIQSPTKPLSISASISNDSSPSKPDPKPSPFVQTTCVAIAAAAFFLARFNHGGVAIAATPVVPPPQESFDTVAPEEELRVDVEELRSLIETKIKANQLGEAVEVLDRLIELEPKDLEWPLLKANLYSVMGEHDLALAEFEEILKKDPLRVEAFNGLAMVTSESSNGGPDKLRQVLKRVEAAMKLCEKQKNKSEVRDFKLLIAQIRVMESNYSDALKLYQELVKEEPRDFRPYLCQGIIYTLLRNKDEAEKHFNTFRSLVPKNHPYREYFEDNMFATNFFAKAEREMAGSRS